MLGIWPKHSSENVIQQELSAIDGYTVQREEVSGNGEKREKAASNLEISCSVARGGREDEGSLAKDAKIYVI
jgi:hypothetical protein